MVAALRFPPRTPIIDDRTGYLTREWESFFRQLYERVGGAEAPTPTDISTDLFEDAGSSETVAVLYNLTDALGQRELIEALRAQVMQLTKEIDALKQAIQS